MLKAWARLGWDCPYSVLIVAAVTSAFSVYYAVTNIGLMLNRNDMLLARENRFHKLYLDYQKEFAPRDDIVVLVEGEDEDALRRTVEDLAERIRSEPALTDLFYKMDLKYIKGRELLYRELGDLVDYLDGLRRLESEVGAGEAAGGFSLARMLSPLSRVGMRRGTERNRLSREDLERLDAILENIESALEGRDDYRTPWDPDAGKRPDLGLAVPDPSSPDPENRVPTHSYLAMRRKDGLPMYTMLMRSTHEDRQGVPAIRRILADYKPPAGVSVGLTGEPVIEEDENEASNKNMTLISILALLGILVVFALIFREFLRPFFGVVGLLVGLCWSAAYLVFVVGHLNIVSVCFVAILMGLGIDVGIHVIGRYEEERAAGLDGPAAIMRAYATAGPGILSGTLTTACAFLTVLLVDFRGIVELGIIAGGGIVLCMAAILTVAPALLRLTSRREPVEAWRARLAGHSAPAGAPRWVLRRPVSVAIGGAVLAAASALGISSTSFDYNMLNLQSPGAESIRLAMHMLENADGSLLFAIASYGDLDTLRRKRDEFEALPVVKKTESVLSPLPEEVEAKRPILREMRDPVRKILGTLARRQPDQPRTMAASLAALQVGLVAGSVAERDADVAKTARRMAGRCGRLSARLLSGPAKETAERLAAVEERMLSDLEANIRFLESRLDPPDVAVGDLPAPFRARYIGRSGGYLIQIFPRENVFEREPQARFVSELRKVEPDVTGSPVQLYEFVELLRRSFEIAGAYAVLVILLIVILDFRRIVPAVLALVPLGFGMLCLCGIMALAGLRFNAANIFVLPLLMGIGVVNGIHLLNRFRQDGFPAICKPLLGTSTGTCMLGCSLTTIIGFSVLLLNPHRGIQSLGAVMSIGMVTTLIGATVLLPAVIALVFDPSTRTGAMPSDCVPPKQP